MGESVAETKDPAAEKKPEAAAAPAAAAAAPAAAAATADSKPAAAAATGSAAAGDANGAVPPTSVASSGAAGVTAAGSVAIPKPKLTSEQVEGVEFCRGYLKEIAKAKEADKATLVHAMKIRTTLGMLRHLLWRSVACPHLHVSAGGASRRCLPALREACGRCPLLRFIITKRS